MRPFRDRVTVRVIFSDEVIVRDRDRVIVRDRDRFRDRVIVRVGLGHT